MISDVILTIVQLEQMRHFILTSVPKCTLPTQLFYFCPINIQTLQMLSSNLLWFSHPKQFNDPFDSYLLKHIIMKKNSHDEKGTDVSQIVNEIRIRSLSSEINEVLLWSHYAEGHKGMAIEIELNREQLALQHVAIAPVTYKTLSDQNIIKDKPGGSIPDFYFSKEIFWEYEHEYRMLSFSPYLLRENFLENKKSSFKIKSITFGLKTSLEIKRLVQKVIQVPFFVMEAAKDDKGRPFLKRKDFV